MKYCESIYQTKRRQTREVKVGKVGVGGAHPIRIQSMTNSSTRDVDATVEQVIRLADEGCEIVRFTVQGKKEAFACEQIKNQLIQKGYGDIPLVADIHFYPPAAMIVADFVEKIRVNPGNYADQRASFKEIEYTDDSYASEIEKIEVKFSPLVQKCKKLGRAMRIGTNHGSLSDRIMNRYGDTPQGMVESAVEYANICRQHGYHNFLFSMKSSNPKVMIQAYRLLSLRMDELGWDYPFHLGVTEAGEGEEGRVKSSIGMGALLLDGIGDTIRVSLTEDPYLEIDPCKRLIRIANSFRGQGSKPFEEHGREIEVIKKRHVHMPESVPLHRDGSVYLKLTEEHLLQERFLEEMGIKEDKKGVDAVDGIVLQAFPSSSKTRSVIDQLKEKGVGIFTRKPHPQSSPIVTLNEFQTLRSGKQQLFGLSTFPLTIGVIVSEEEDSNWDLLKEHVPSIIFWTPKNNRFHETRRFFEWMYQQKIKIPVIINFEYSGSQDDLILQASAEVGALICDGLGEGMMLETPCSPSFIKQLSLQILQGARMRTFKTEFISCPSCGRTLFDLQEVSRRIRKRTTHLPGVKIAIMGCIVNGPGEMADADFGYVGSKAGMVDLYVKKECVEKNIPFDQADDRLVELIKSHGRWIEKEELVGV